MKLITILSLLISSHLSFGQSGPTKLEVIGGEIVINDVPVHRDSDVALLSRALGEPSRIKKRTTKSPTTKKRSKWVDYYFDEDGIRVSKAAESGELITVKLSYERIKKLDPKGTYSGSVWIDGINFDANSRESELHKILKGYSIREILSLYIIGKNDFTFLMTYRYGGDGVKDFTFTFK